VASQVSGDCVAVGSKPASKLIRGLTCAVQLSHLVHLSWVELASHTVGPWSYCADLRRCSIDLYVEQYRQG
jgi:hypothetical protein